MTVQGAAFLAVGKGHTLHVIFISLMLAMASCLTPASDKSCATRGLGAKNG